MSEKEVYISGRLLFCRAGLFMPLTEEEIVAFLEYLDDNPLPQRTFEEKQAMLRRVQDKIAEKLNRVN